MFCDGMNRKVFLSSSWYDLGVSVLFSLPITLTFVWSGMMIPLHEVLGLHPLEPLSPHGTLFANFFGSVVTIWAIVRIKLADVRLALYDGIARGLFCIAMINAIMLGASPLLWVFFVPEITFCILQLIGAFVAHRRRVSNLVVQM